MSTHTPGPWIVANDPRALPKTIARTQVRSVDGTRVARCDEENDARLIAAAPDLVAALKEGAGHDRDLAGLHYLARRFTDNAPIVGSDKEAAAQIISEYARFIRYARAALAKVEG